MRTVRVALCQLESHPAIYSGHIAYPEEPFVTLACYLQPMIVASDPYT